MLESMKTTTPAFSHPTLVRRGVTGKEAIDHRPSVVVISPLSMDDLKNTTRHGAVSNKAGDSGRKAASMPCAKFLTFLWYNLLASEIIFITEVRKMKSSERSFLRRLFFVLFRVSIVETLSLSVNFVKKK